MKYLQIIVEGSSEENFVNDVLAHHFAPLNIFIATRKIRTGWDSINKKPAKGGVSKYSKFRNDVLRWIESDKDRAHTYYTSFIDLYAFPTDSESPYTKLIREIEDPYKKILALENAIGLNINHPKFIPYVQLHEFEAFLLVDPDKLLGMFPDSALALEKLKKNIGNTAPEEVNDSFHTAPSKRIVKYFPDYKGQKAQVGPMVAEDIGISKLRTNCPHFNDWITRLEQL